MIRSKKKQYIILITIIALIFSLSVAYAVLSSTLTISGTTEVTATKWGFKLIEVPQTYSPNHTPYETIGSATATKATFSGTTMSYNISLTKPGDSVTYYMMVSGDGTLPGEISSIIQSTPSCTSATGNTADAQLVCSNLKFSLEYVNVSNINYGPVQAGDVISECSLSQSGCTICLKGNNTGLRSSRVIKYTIGFNESATQISSSAVTINNLKIDINISQTDKECVYKDSNGTPEK